MKTEPDSTGNLTSSFGETTGRPFVIMRTFNAARDRVWRAWTNPEHFRQWFGPKGSTVTDVNMDVRAGGSCHCCIRTPDGREMWGKFVYREITEPERLVYAQHFSDRAGGVTRHPMVPSWPLQMLTTVALVEQNGKTTVTVNWAPVNPTDEETKTFDSAHEGMNQGWGGSFDQLADFLAQ
ncbi:MAG TPA: SRPBCC domain-containing protein [Verrucomicrobiae bacterium]|nr:SRPBCC domain-containing protein [Verrucomicrobiae bacterium]